MSNPLDVSGGQIKTAGGTIQGEGDTLDIHYPIPSYGATKATAYFILRLNSASEVDPTFSSNTSGVTASVLGYVLDSSTKLYTVKLSVPVVNKFPLLDIDLTIS